MTEVTGRVAARDGRTLAFRSWRTEEAEAAVLVLHGLFERSRRYRELGEMLAARGLDVFALDLRGHGASEGRRGHVRRFEDFLDDVDRFQRQVESYTPGLPRFLIAHSMGGLIALRYLERFDPALAGAVISAPWLAMTEPVPRWQSLAAALLSRIWPTAPFQSTMDPNNLSHDEDRVADYVDDPMIFSHLTPRLWTEVGRAWEQVVAEGAGIAVPILFLVPLEDRVADPDRTLAFARSLGGDVTVRELKGYYHEVFQEVGRADIFREVETWLRERMP